VKPVKSYPFRIVKHGPADPDDEIVIRYMARCPYCGNYSAMLPQDLGTSLTDSEWQEILDDQDEIRVNRWPCDLCGKYYGVRFKITGCRTVVHDD